MNKKYVLTGVLATALALGGTAYAADTTTTLTNTLPSFSKEMRGGKGMKGERGAVEAKLLGITREEFTARIKNGENPRTMLTNAGISEEALRTAMHAAMKEKLAADVAAGTITQAQADARATEMEARHTQHTAMENAVASGDFTAFEKAVAGTPLEGKLTATTFPRYVEAQKLMEQARTIMTELGVEGMGHGGPGGMHRGR